LSHDRVLACSWHPSPTKGASEYLQLEKRNKLSTLKRDIGTTAIFNLVNVSNIEMIFLSMIATFQFTFYGSDELG
jgi:hypothetical protein